MLTVQICGMPPEILSRILPALNEALARTFFIVIGPEDISAREIDSAAVFFPQDLMLQGLAEEIVIEIKADKQFHPKVLRALVKEIGAVVHEYCARDSPTSRVTCFATRIPRQLVWTSDEPAPDEQPPPSK